jgi:PIN domain nuclease of toxin-antitoxin system
LKLLLDTHVWLWRLLEPARLARRAATVLSDSANELYLSPISVWETLVLARKGRLELDPPPGAWVREALARSSLKMAPLTHGIAIASEGLTDFASNDPADRFLVATALEHKAVLVTADRQVLDYRGIRTIAAA